MKRLETVHFIFCCGAAQVRSFTVLDGIGKSLNPRFDISEIAAPYARGLLLEARPQVAKLAETFRKRVGLQNRAVKNLFTGPNMIEVWALHPDTGLCHSAKGARNQACAHCRWCTSLPVIRRGCIATSLSFMSMHLRLIEVDHHRCGARCRTWREP